MNPEDKTTNFSRYPNQMRQILLPLVSILFAYGSCLASPHVAVDTDLRDRAQQIVVGKIVKIEKLTTFHGLRALETEEEKKLEARKMAQKFLQTSKQDVI